MVGTRSGRSQTAPSALALEKGRLLGAAMRYVSLRRYGLDERTLGSKLAASSPNGSLPTWSMADLGCRVSLLGTPSAFSRSRIGDGEKLIHCRMSVVVGLPRLSRWAPETVLHTFLQWGERLKARESSRAQSTKPCLRRKTSLGTDGGKEW